MEPRSIILLSGPIGAGKSTVAKELIQTAPGGTAYIEGDTFWSFIARPEKQTRFENFKMIMRSMIAAAVPYALNGYEVTLDYVVLRPSEAV